MAQENSALPDYLHYMTKKSEQCHHIHKGQIYLIYQHKADILIATMDDSHSFEQIETNDGRPDWSAMSTRLNSFRAFPHLECMKSEDARLRTFSNWPSWSPVQPHDLVQAGMFYVPESDRQVDKRSSAHYSSMESFEERLESFRDRVHPINPERLARAGFSSIGDRDYVVCFKCGGCLKNWQPDEDPWEEHAKHYPGCSFLLAEKGREFINSVQLRTPGRSSSNGFFSRERDEDPLEKLEKLQREKLCKVCLDSDIAIVFIPCGHLVTCKKCSEPLRKCPICRADITHKIKTFSS
ncbi:hypothetical protein AMELA_G00035350 [Ameiurus melas]|uniref:E3 ubiquitin-protein ligase XIAP n=1 Tax=Ameiurus melas TaxID=219545 RepID=A0A7J6B8D6_AMEME|nr:hypothetical protein AMELA_G00035350 [Ameiurus melas]